MNTDSVRDLYDGLGERYDRWTKGLNRFAFDSMREGLLAHAKGDVLEVAVGTGKNFAYYPSGCSIVGVDVSSNMLREAERGARKHGRTFEAVVADAHHLPYEDASFDTVVCTLAACTFDDPVPVLREMGRVCKPAGRTLFLEHTRPLTPVRAMLFETMTPFAVWLLGCHPNRNALHNIRAAGFATESVSAGFDGIAVSVVARPHAA